MEATLEETADKVQPAGNPGLPGGLGIETAVRAPAQG